MALLELIDRFSPSEAERPETMWDDMRAEYAADIQTYVDAAGAHDSAILEREKRIAALETEVEQLRADLAVANAGDPVPSEDEPDTPDDSTEDQTIDNMFEEVEK